MGFIASLTSKDFPGQNTGTATWNRIFGATDKESAHKQPVTPGGSWGRSVTAGDAAYKRLLQAMRSRAPGGWTDDRYEQTRHWISIAYVCGHRLGEYLSMAEFEVFMRDDNHQDGKRPVKRHEEAYKLCRILEKPNKTDSFGDLCYQWIQQIILTGKALTWMVPNVLGVPMELYPIPTAIAIPQPAINPDFPDGFYRIQPVYPYGPFSSYPTPTTSVGAPIGAQWMMEFKFPHPLLRYEGYSPLTALRLQLDEVDAMDRSRWYTMKRTINPSAVLNFSDMEGAQALPEAEIERIRADFENEHQGPENHGKLYVATPGANLEPWTPNLHDLEYRDGWEQLVSFAMAGFGITKPAAGMIEDSSYSTLFATLKQLYEQTLDPMCNRFAQKITRQLGHFFGDDLIVEIRCRRIDDHELKERRLRLAMEAQIITKNQMARELELPVTKEPWGEEMAGAQSQPQGMVDPTTGQPLPVDPVTGMPLESAPGPENPEEPEVSQTRPTPGPLGQGALGPTKAFKSLKASVDQLRTDVSDIQQNMKSLRRKYRSGFSRNGVH